MLEDKIQTPPKWDGPSTDPFDEQFGDIVEPVSPSSASDTDVLLVGEPYDGAVLSCPGARNGPGGIRDALEGTKSAHLFKGSVTNIGDLGDIDIPQRKSVSETQSWMKEVTAAIHELDTFPVFIGGDHSVSYPNIRPLIDDYDSVGVVNIDAHADVRKVVDEPYNGTPFGQLLNEGLEAYAFVGARNYETSAQYLSILEDHNATVIAANEVGDDPQAAAERAVDGLDEVDAIYVSCDTDVLNMTASPGSTAPTPGGLTTRELYELLWSLAAEPRLCGFDYVGTAPSLDPSDRTVKAGSRAVAHFIGGFQASQT
jgi:formiminoglutamase/agmatinase